MFWGCTIPARFPFIEKATRLALLKLGVDAVDVPGFTCCPETTLVRSADPDAYYLTAARNLAVAERQRLPLMTPCNGCYSTFKSVLSDLRIDWRRRDAINRRLSQSGLRFSGDIDVWHLVEWLADDFGPAALSKRVVKPFWGMRLALHHGCHLLRPTPAVNWDSPTAPVKFEQLVRALGATVVDYETKMDCCGNALDRVGERDRSLNMLQRKLSDIREEGAHGIVLCCPSCFLQFDLNQATLVRESKSGGLPVFYITELIALAADVDPDELGLGMHRVGVAPFVEKWSAKLAERTKLGTVFSLADLQTCASCRACDTDCPVAQSDDSFVPSAIISQLLSGDLDGVLDIPGVWHCVDCMTCYERCHSRLGMAEVFEHLRQLARERGKMPSPARANYETFTTTGMLGTPRQSAREKLGLPELPATGSDDLVAMLSEPEEGE